MDAKGAQELARRLSDRHGELIDARPEPLKNADAAPIFHWLGIEPPRIVDANDETQDSARRRRRR